MDNKTVDMVFSFIVKEGMQERYDNVIKESMTFAKSEEGTLVYEIFKDENGTYCQHELYADEQACILHCTNTAKQLEEWFQIVELKSLVALGPLSDEFKKQWELKEHYLPYAKVNK